MESSAISTAHATKLIIAGLVIIGIASLHFSGLLDTDELLRQARSYSDRWWLLPVLLLAQVVLYTFALSGSYALWVTAPIYPPLTATAILAAGGTLGAICAYFFSRFLTDKWLQRVERSRAYRLIQAHNNFISSLALRVMPGFPHSLINYSSGILKTRLSHFVPAAILGFSIKFYVYSSVISSAAMAADQDAPLDLSILWPLVALSLFLLSGLLVKARMNGGQSPPRGSAQN